MPDPTDSSVAGRESWMPRLYELTTGAAAVQEALQLDRMLGAGDAQGPSTIDVDSIPGIDRPSIPFDKLLEGKTPVVEETAKYAPPDGYYAHFPSIPALRRLVAESDRWGGHLLSSYRLSGNDARLRTRIEDRLLLQSSPELDPFYQLVVGEVAIVGSDPYLIEGSDITVVFALKAPALFSARMEMARRQAAPGNVRVVQEQYRGWQIDGLSSADRSVSSYSSVRGSVGLVGTSLAGVRRIIDTVNGTLPSLAASEDFRYARTVYPYASETEDGFLFLSDAFVRRVVGPRQKIAEARRVRCAVSLQSVSFGDMLFRSERREPPTSLEELYVRRYLERGATLCPDGGQYSLTAGASRCSIHGQVGSMTPLIEIPLQKVTEDESRSYGVFREEYKTYWRRFVDPVAVRARARDQLEVDATILPLVENSAYRSVSAEVGGEPVDLTMPRLASTIAAVDAKINLKPPTDVRAESWEVLLSRGVGEKVTLQVPDSSPIVVPNLAGGAGAFFGGRLGFVGTLAVFLTMPVAAVAPIRDKSALDRAREGIRHDIRNERTTQWFGVSSYEMVTDAGIPAEAVVVEVEGVKIRVYYAVVGNWLVVTNTMDLLGAFSSASESEGATGNLRLELTPRSWQAYRPAMALAYSEEARVACRPNLAWYEAFAASFSESPSALRDRMMRALGFELSCPGGGDYSIPGDGIAVCSQHGTALAPRQGTRPLAGSSAAFVLEHVGHMGATLSFTPQGISSRIVIRRVAAP